MTLRPLNLNQALAFDRLEEFVRKEEESGAELVKGSDFERALALLITRRWSEAQYRYRRGMAKVCEGTHRKVNHPRSEEKVRTNE
jgi:hypothetical protein